MSVLTAVFRLLVAPLTLLRGLVGVLFALLVGLLRVVLVLVVVSLLVVAALQAGGVGVLDDVPVPGGSDDAVAPGDPDGSDYRFDEGQVNSTAVEREIHDRVNERRADRGLDPLAWDSTVASVSRAHSKDMADRGYFSHTTPEGDGPRDRYREVGQGCYAYGENIAMSWAGRPVDTGDQTVTYTSDEALAEGLVTQWMESPSHRANMLNDRWESGGVGVYVTDDGQVFATHNFCRGFGL